MTDRKFYRTIFQVEVLSESPYDAESLTDIAYDIDEGEESGLFCKVSVDELDGAEMAKALQGQSSDPEFFCLDAEGNDLEYKDNEYEENE